jgi:hypothetical protein
MTLIDIEMEVIELNVTTCVCVQHWIYNLSDWKFVLEFMIILAQRVSLIWWLNHWHDTDMLTMFNNLRKLMQLNVTACVGIVLGRHWIWYIMDIDMLIQVVI